MRRRACRPRILAAAPPLLIFLAPPAPAVDGVREINQACATSTTGCFTSDTGDFPVQITASGSYRLTGNLTLPNGDTTAILVSSPDVAIDLNGFQIVCPGCAAGTGNGVEAVTGASRLSVRNGTIREVGGAGIDAASHTDVEDVAVLDAGSYGIRSGEHTRVSECLVAGSGVDGISLGLFGVVSSSTALANAGDGIAIASLGRISGSNASGNTGRGVYCLGRCNIHGNVVYQNTQDGIWASEGSIQGNAVRSNLAGITSFASIVVGNTIVDNTFHGLQAGPSTAYGRNVLDGNNGGGDQVSLGNPVGLNVCGSDTTCP